MRPHLQDYRYSKVVEEHFFDRSSISVAPFLYKTSNGRESVRCKIEKKICVQKLAVLLNMQ